jgi:hypothetical protein
MADLSELVGAEVSGVNFVRDYFELHFDGPVLRILGRFCVEHNGVQTLQTSCGWRDVLCGLIGHTVEEVSLREGFDCSVRLSGQIELRVSLVPDSESGPETLHFMPWPKKEMLIW